MFQISENALSTMKAVWGDAVDPTRVFQSSLGLYAIILENASLFHPAVRDSFQCQPGGSGQDPIVFVRRLLGDLPQEAFNCGIWMPVPRAFQAICPHKSVEVTATILISAFQLGVCSPLACEYPGYLRAQQGLINFFYELSQTHGALATQVWSRMNAAQPFRDPAAAMAKYTDRYYDERDWA